MSNPGKRKRKRLALEAERNTRRTRQHARSNQQAQPKVDVPVLDGLRAGAPKRVPNMIDALFKRAPLPRPRPGGRRKKR